jgi:hypothetical protein
VKTVDSQLGDYQRLLETHLGRMEQQEGKLAPGLLKIFHGIGKIFSSDISPAEDRFEKQSQLIQHSFDQAKLARQAGKFQEAYQWLQKADTQLDVAARNVHRGTQASGDFTQKYIEPLTWGLGVGATLALAASPMGVAVALGLGISGAAHAVGLNLLANKTPEPKIPNSVQEQQGPQKLRSLKEINLEAEAALRLWKKNPQASFHMGRFLIESALAVEGTPESSQKFELQSRQWDRFTEDVNHDFGEKEDPSLIPVKRASARTVQKFLTDYKEELGRLTDGLDGQGGNCDTQTQAIVSAILDGKIKIPKPYVLGIQVYRRHAQPVLLNEETHEVLNLVTGLAPKKMGIIYHPNLLLHAYLKGQGIVPPVSEEELIIWKPSFWKPSFWKQSFFAKKEAAGKAPETNSLLQYPESEVELSDAPNPGRGEVPVVSSDAPIPKRGIIPVPFQDEIQTLREPNSEGNHSININIASLVTGPDADKNFLIQSGGLDFIFESKRINQDPEDFWESGEIIYTIFFRHPWQLDHFNSLKNMEEKRSFIVDLTRMALRDFFKDKKDLATLKSFLEDTPAFLAQRPFEVNHVRRLLENSSKILANAESAYWKLGLAMHLLPTEDQTPLLEFLSNTNLPKEFPGLEAIDASNTIFSSWEISKPQEIFKILSPLHPGVRFDFLQILQTFQKYYKKRKYDHMDPLINFALKKGVLEVNDALAQKWIKENERTPSEVPEVTAAMKPSEAEHPEDGKTDLVEVDLVEDASNPEEKMATTSENKTTRTQHLGTKIIISTEAMLDFLLFYAGENSWRDIYRFWTPKISQAFHQKNKAGVLDNWFLKIKKNIQFERLPAHLREERARRELQNLPLEPLDLPPDLLQIDQDIQSRKKSTSISSPPTPPPALPAPLP